MVSIDTIGVPGERRGSIEAAATRTGPNDAFRVVWAIGEYFLFFLRVFLY
jgi:hypothetical protein